MTLWADFLNNQGRVIHKWTHYFPIYESHFAEFVNKPIVFIEIGCGEGGSLKMWKRYFGPFAKIIGIDINPKCKEFEEDQIEIRIGDQSDAKFIQSVVDEFGNPDIVLDDGSHVMSHITATFNTLYPQLSKNGVYLVEDLHTAYWNEWEGGLRRQGSFIETCKSLIDELNADHTQGALTPTKFTSSTLSMHFYDSVVVFQRGAHLHKHAPMFGTKTI